MSPAQIRNESESGHLKVRESGPISGASDDTPADSADSAETPLPGDDEDALILNGSRAGGLSLGDEDNDDGHDDDDNDDGVPEAQDYSGFAALIGSASAKRGSSTAPGVSGPMPNRKQQISSQTIRKGEKDFEEHGTRAQRDALEQSRAVMESVLAHTRVHYGSTVADGASSSGGGGGADAVRGYYFPGVWQDYLDEEEELEALRKLAPNTGTSAQVSQGRRFAHTRHRVVMVEANRGVMFSSVGAVPGRPRWVEGVPKAQQPKPRPGFDRIWLLPEEALFLMERGSMELYWPLQDSEAVLDKIGEEGRSQRKLGDIDDDHRLEVGIPLSLQAAYSLLIGPDTDTPRGRVSLPSYQVYTHLRRAGYQVLRAVKTDPETPLDTPSSQQQIPPAPASLWQWLFSFISPPPSPLPSYCRGVDPTSPPPPHLPHGPLVRPGLYRSYAPIYSQLRLISRHIHRSASHAAASSPAEEGVTPPSDNPFRIVYHVWKAGASAATAGTGSSTAFSKTHPPPPDFYLSVADAHATAVPSLEQVTELLASVPPLPTRSHPGKKGRQAGAAPSREKTLKAAKAAKTATPNLAKPASSTAMFPPLPIIYRRLKLGRRCVIIAVVDHGIVNYMRFSDGNFGTDPLWPRFDSLTAGRFSAGINGGAGARKGRGKSGGGKNQKNQKKKSGGGKNSKGASAFASTAAVAATATVPPTPAPAPDDSRLQV
ncbi:tRNA-splicing endonuclease subunit sen54 [Sporothrix curviconia]|uniref:tRNA-splicing endonuclease subunit sen54 n=1 Tax=Sporothrix curviconia TaxID=1260050 RepID=A0ABP0C694_9PEZI